MKKRVSITIGIPNQGTWAAGFGMSLAFMMVWCEQNQILARSDKQKIEVVEYRGSILPQLRENLVYCAQQADATHLLFIDSDQTFPKDMLRTLVGHEQPVVAANISTKSDPAAPTARMKKDTSPIGGSLVFSHGKSGLEQVWRVGTGVMLIDMAVFQILEPPYFSMYWDSRVGKYQGEDWVFCEKLENAGIPIFVDHTVSNKIGHVGTKTYTHEDIPPAEELKKVYDAREKAAKEQAA